MADLNFVAADVRPLPGAQTLRIQAAAAITPGQAVYVDTDGKANLADADAAASANPFLGICVSAPNGGAAAAINEYIDVVYLGRVTGFTGLTPGDLAYLSTTAGDLADAAPAGSSGDFLMVAGIVLNATTILINPYTPDLAAQ